jgi:hypothetical protein
METKPAQTGTYASRIPENPQDILDRRFARFALHPLTDSDVWTLAMAAMVMPDGNPGAEAYLAQVSGTDLFHGRLTVWGRVVALGIAHASYKARNGVRRREYVEGYEAWWGEYAVADGLSLALYGKAEDALGRAAGNSQGYIRIRDFVGGALVSAIAEYRVALEWAAGYRRDRVLAGRWEGITGLNYRDAQADANIGREGANCSPMFAPGCGRTAALQDVDDRLKPRVRGQEPKAPETRYHSLRPTDWWDASYAKMMRDAPIRMIYPATD